MNVHSLIARVRNRLRRDASLKLARSIVDLRPERPIVSFTFDDFPRTALHAGGGILRKYDCTGTYYVSLGLVDSEIPAGRAFSMEDVQMALTEGHELGCHTFAHCHAWDSRPEEFEESVIQNRIRLQQLHPQVQLRSLSYPISWPRPATKRRVRPHFACARSTGTSFNIGYTDAFNLQAVFIEKHRDAPGHLLQLIHQNQQAGGWLIFATHDVAEAPSEFGCSPELFEKLVAAASDSGAKILPVARAWDEIFKQRMTKGAENRLG